MGALCAHWWSESGKTNSLFLEFVSCEEYKGKECIEMVSLNCEYLKQLSSKFHYLYLDFGPP